MTFLFASVPVSLLYAAPISVVVVLAAIMQSRARKQVVAASKIATKVVAQKALREFLKDQGLENVEVVQSADYSKNAYDAARDRIELSPDAIDSIDVGSIALALRAGSGAVAAKRAPEKASFVAKLRTTETLAFWVVFCAFAFGIMANSAPLNAVAWGCLVALFVLERVRANVVAKLDVGAESFARESKLFEPDLAEAIVKTMRALR